MPKTSKERDYEVSMMVVFQQRGHQHIKARSKQEAIEKSKWLAAWSWDDMQRVGARKIQARKADSNE